MKLLLIHAEKFEYEAREKAIEQAESLSEENKKKELENVLVVFSTIEENDSRDFSIVDEAAKEVVDIARQLSVINIIIYPYAHLSEKLAKPSEAILILRSFEDRLKKLGFNVTRAPFGWYKRFEIKCYGHPLAELSRTIRPGKIVRTGFEEYAVFFPDGKVLTIEELDPNSLNEMFKALLEAEVFKKARRGGVPKYLEYCKKFGFEWESMSDLGHMRYGPEAALIMDIIAEYAWQCACSLGIPVFKIKGTNTFNLEHKPVKQHAELYGDRLYTIHVDEKSFILRYAACHQQFAMLKDWNISYKNLPFGVFEIADSYRLEQPGELVLCFRLRKFFMPDLHILCKDLEEAKKISIKVHEKIYEEIRKLGRDYVSIYNMTKSFLENNKDFILELVKREEKPVLIHFVPEGKYYWVINIEYNIIDQLRRPREIGTFQIDVGNAKRFEITYIDEKGEKKYPVIIHTALIGSLERYVYAVLDTAVLEAEKGKRPSLPFWLSPIQVRIIPHTLEYLRYSNDVANILEEHGFRVDIDDREESVAKRVRDAEVKWIPYIVFIGKREIESGKLSVRIRGEGNLTLNLEELLERLERETRDYPKISSTLPRLLSVRPGYR